MYNLYLINLYLIPVDLVKSLSLLIFNQYLHINIINWEYLYFPTPGPLISSWLQPPAPGPGPKFVFTGPGLQFVFTGPGPQFVFTDSDPQFVLTPNLYLTAQPGLSLHIPTLSPNLYLLALAYDLYAHRLLS